MQITIGPLSYAVVEVEELASASGELYGDINYERCRIRIRAESDPQIKHVTLWHEVLHGILRNAAIEDHDEQQIDALAHGIIQVLRDNPQLTAVVSTGKTPALQHGDTRSNRVRGTRAVQSKASVAS